MPINHTTADILLAVSLSNRSFTRPFAGHFVRWASERQCSKIDVVLFDVIESINLRAFRGLDPDSAAQSATARGNEIRRMFEKAVRGEGKHARVTLESESPIPRTSEYRDTVIALRTGFNADPVFRHEAEQQVLGNLADRIEKHGIDAVRERLPDLVEYVFQEVAFFYAFFVKNPDYTEAYPGPNMPLKERVFSGEYEKRMNIPALTLVPKYVDISWLGTEEVFCTTAHESRSHVALNKPLGK